MGSSGLVLHPLNRVYTNRVLMVLGKGPLKAFGAVFDHFPQNKNRQFQTHTPKRKWNGRPQAQTSIFTKENQHVLSRWLLRPVGHERCQLTGLSLETWKSRNLENLESQKVKPKSEQFQNENPFCPKC